MIAIFPGHFGEGPGAVDGKDNTGDNLYTVEATINLAVAERVAGILSSVGIPHEIYTGSLQKRTEDANAAGCTLGISIHCDSVPAVPERRGAHMLVWPGSFYGEMLGHHILGFWDSLVFNRIPIHSRKLTPRPDLYILRETRFPVALIEMGFLTNPEDEQAFQDPYVHGLAAHAIASGIITTVNAR